jgi:hypothetical protein
MIVIAYKDIFAKIGTAFKTPVNAKDVMTTLLHIDWAVNGLSWQREPRVFAMNSSGKLIQIIGGPLTGQPERVLVIGHGRPGAIGNLTLPEVKSLADQINKISSIKLCIQILLIQGDM